MSKHTPGPWTHAGYARSMAFRVTKTPDDATGDVCNVLAGLAAKTNEEVEANARLIAAAPELLSALKEARRWIGDGDLSDGMEREIWTQKYAAAVDLVDAAIAKATGELFNTEGKQPAQGTEAGPV
jgi:hypothetical protein